jgi:hypothetical protein
LVAFGALARVGRVRTTEKGGNGSEHGGVEESVLSVVLEALEPRQQVLRGGQNASRRTP